MISVTNIQNIQCKNRELVLVSLVRMPICDLIFCLDAHAFTKFGHILKTLSKDIMEIQNSSASKWP